MSEYSLREVGLAVGHGDVGNYRRNLCKIGALTAWRLHKSGPGKKLTYDEVAELRLFVVMTELVSRELAQRVIAGVLRDLPRLRARKSAVAVYTADAGLLCIAEEPAVLPASAVRPNIGVLFVGAILDELDRVLTRLSREAGR